ncbi:AAA family ATPase [Lawsonibacter celer]|uniref:cytidylate kinase-like family protein n=1 Tax=Lawsonibacter celer TaxID=2986526 RepID=UPI001644BA8B|nr:cytidylate kinase-like family protein [Lawsonibacter celer]
MKPFILCIGRQYGSGGREVGERVAEALRVPCYDKLLLQRTAHDSGLSESLLARCEERPAYFSAMLSGNSLADTADMSNLFYSESQMVYNAEAAEIRRLARQGSCVIVGRCASAILEDYSGVRSVFLYADAAERVRRIMDRNHLDEAAARRRMHKIDHMRKSRFNFYSDTHWGLPESYDLMLSSSRCGIEGCVQIITDSLKHFS